MAYETTPEKEAKLFGEDPIMEGIEKMWLGSALYWVRAALDSPFDYTGILVGIDGSPEIKALPDLVKALRESDEPEAQRLIKRWDKRKKKRAR